MRNKALFIAFLSSFISLHSFSQSYKADIDNSRIGFSVTHLLISKFNGRFSKYNAGFSAVKKDFTDAKIFVEIQANSFTTGEKERDVQIMDKDFLNVADYPLITFSSYSMRKIQGNEYKLTGALTIHGVTRAISLKAIYNGSALDPEKHKTVYGFKVTGAIDRTSYGIATKVPNAILTKTILLDMDILFTKK